MCQEQSWLLLHLCDVGLATLWLSTLLGPMAKLATVVAGAVSCRLLVVDGAPPSAHPCAPAWAPPCDLCRLPRLRPLVEGGDSPFFPSPWQVSHCSRVKCSFPPTVIGPERGCGSSPSTTLRRPIASSIDIVERSSRDSIERSACTSRGCTGRASRRLSPRRRCRRQTAPSSAAEC
jgi:hypothetical protein